MKKSTQTDDHELRTKILQLLAAPKYQPLDKVELSRKLKLPAERRAELRALLNKMEVDGAVARIRKDRYIIPEVADLVTGTIIFHQNGAAHVLNDKKGAPELFIAAEDTATALNGDKVVARIISGEGGKSRSIRQMRPGQREARVIRVLVRANSTVVGTLQQGRHFAYVIPDDPRIGHDIYVANPANVSQKNGPTARIGDKVVVKLEPWESRQSSPEGEIVEVLGAATDPGVDLLSIVRKYRLPTEFPAAVLKEADRISNVIAPQEIAARDDCRRMDVITIDPDDAKDFDDAILVERLADGWRLAVHIADVSHYVDPGSALDREAYLRGNSVYLVDRVIPMLPEKLSNGICSLKPNEDRLTRAAFITFSQDGKVRAVRFARAVIRSAARLTYRQAFAILNNSESSPGFSPQVVERVRTAWELASVLRKNRFAAGSLDLDFPEVKVWLDDDKRPVRIEKVENDISHQLVEEFMLVANEVVAKALKNRQVPAIYRIHDKPDDQRLLEYRELAVSHGYKPGDLTQRTHVQRFLASLRGRPEEYALKLGFLKSLKRAEYDTNPIGHYGLAKTNYTHFTSPIRRYADLIVHRLLGPQPGADHRASRPIENSGNLGAVAKHMSETERVAADAEKDSVKLKKLEFFQRQLQTRRPDAFRAVVVEVRNFGLFVELPDYLVTGVIHVSTLAKDFYEFDAVRMRFIGRRTRKVYKVGDLIEVIVVRVDVYKKQIDFAPAAERSSARR